MATTRTIEAAPLPTRHARGWHSLGLAANYRDGKPHAISAFSTRLVVFMGEEDGQLHIIDAYCPHMGADLNLGTVHGNSIRCIFHNWSWGGDGICNDIPYAKRIPPAARIKSWPTQEENKLLFVWNDPEHSIPTREVAMPRIPACFSDDWNDWVFEQWTVNSNCREVIDNVSDIPHFAPVHGIPIGFYGNLFEDHKATQIMVGERPSREGGLTTCATYFGPACQITDMRAGLGDTKIDAILLNCVLPITHESFVLSLGMLSRKIPGLTEEQNKEMAKTFIGLTQIGFKQDMNIWANKVRIDNPLLVEGDGPIYRLRDWYQQFYVDQAKVPASMTERFELRYNPGKVEPVPALHHVLEDW
jgi:3-ketosteroid 9alpha-monooxygenase subunit A